MQSSDWLFASLLLWYIYKLRISVYILFFYIFPGFYIMIERMLFAHHVLDVNEFTLFIQQSEFYI